MFTVKVTTANTVAEKCRKVRDVVMEAIRRSVKRNAMMLLGVVKAEKLSGQVLNVRTGRLRRSITAVFVETADSITAKVGTNVSYARAWEYGFTGSVPVKAHDRLIKKVWGRPLRQAVVAHVNPYSRQVNMSERSFLRSALVEKKDLIEMNLRKSVQRALKGAGE